MKLVDTNRKEYQCVIPAIPEDYARAKRTFHYLFDNLPIYKIIFVGPSSLKKIIDEDKGSYGSIEFIDELDLVDFRQVKKFYDPLLAAATSYAISSVNWYYQQFLKMAYSQVCEDDFYLCWDVDTVPVRKIEMHAQNGKPYLDIKPEYNNSYFITIEKLFGYTKIIESSFISEHMLFNKDYMLEMICEIEKLDFDGDMFYEKIMSAVGSDNLNLGFSEFETYGTYVAMKHQSSYMLRHWKSFRNANFFVDISDLTDKDVEWLAKSYDAATFEKYQSTEELLNSLFRNPRYREKLLPEQFYTTILESGAMGEYLNGKIKVGNNWFPA